MPVLSPALLKLMALALAAGVVLTPLQAAEKKQPPPKQEQRTKIPSSIHPVFREILDNHVNGPKPKKPQPEQNQGFDIWTLIKELGLR